MKKSFYILLFLTGLALNSPAQSKIYASGGSEMIFSFAQIDNNGITGGNIMRWSPVFNVQVYGNVDFGKHFGIFFGGAIRNVGFIYNMPDTNLKKKYRNYNFGIPVGIKVGNMHKFLFFAGYEIEFPCAYKEKTFISGAKQDNKIIKWFSPRTPSYYHTVFVGLQFPYGFNLKFKYYFSEFFNENYTDNAGNQPYMGLKANVWYISLAFAVFRNYGEYYRPDSNKKHKKKQDYY